MKKHLSAVLFFLILVINLQSQVNYRYFVNAGRIELSEDRNTEAIRNFNIAIQAKPEQFEAWFFRGIAKFNLNDYAGSLIDFSETIRLHPLYARAYHYRGIVNDRLSNYYDAKADFSKALEIDPYNADLYVAAGATDMHLNNFDAAIRNYDMALLIYPKYSSAWLNRGIAKRMLNQNEEALHDLNKAVFHDHFDVEAWVKRGILKSELNDFSGALEDLGQALKLDKHNPAIYFQRAHIYLQQGDTITALKDFEQVNILEPRNALTYYNRALLHAIRKELPEAQALYKEVILINPSNIYSYFNLGVIEFELEQYREAEQNFSKAIELFPGFVGAIINRSLVRQKMNDRKGADSDHQNAMAIVEGLTQRGEDPEQLLTKYADSGYFKKIIALEADFVSGNLANQRPQFRSIDIKPFGMMVLAFQPEKSPAIKSKKNQYSDLMTGLVNGVLPDGLQIVWQCEPLDIIDFQTISESKAEVMQKLPYEYQQLTQGVLELTRDNHSRAYGFFKSIPLADAIGCAAKVNEAAVLYAIEENRLLEEQYVRAVTISQGGPGKEQNSRTNSVNMNLNQAFEAIRQSIEKNPKQPFAHYNHGNLLLQSGVFHPAIDAYSEAIALEPSFGEGYYNRALILLFLGENQLACSDLSKAGENGIEEAYVVIRKYCSPQQP